MRDKKRYEYQMNENSPKRILSLFSGCGGLDLGMEGGFDVISQSLNKNIHPEWLTSSEQSSDWIHLPRTVFTTIFANDIREDAKIAWTNYFSKRGANESIYHLASIVDMVKAHYEGNYSFPVDIDIVTGGFPCQDFSVAGKRLGFDSDKSHSGTKRDVELPNEENRGQLYMWMREVISITQPKMFIAENVKGLVNLADAKEIIEEDFRSIGGGGYVVVDAKVLNAADYGVPQGRERVIFFGFRKSCLTKKALKELTSQNINPLYDPYPPKTHAYTDNNESLVPHTTVAQALSGLSEPSESKDLSQMHYSRAKFMGKHCQGQTEISLDGVAPTIRSEHHGNIEFRRLALEHGGKLVHELNRGLSERRLTVRECARIQTFPDDYEFVIPTKKNRKGVSASSAYKIIGNAVPPLLAYHLARRIESNWALYFGDK